MLVPIAIPKYYYIHVIHHNFLFNNFTSINNQFLKMQSMEPFTRVHTSKIVIAIDYPLLVYPIPSSEATYQLDCSPFSNHEAPI